MYLSDKGKKNHLQEETSQFGIRYKVAVKPVLTGIKRAFTSLQKALIPVMNNIKSVWSGLVHGIVSIWNRYGTLL